MKWLSLIGMCLCVVVILYLAYWFTRRIAAGNLSGVIKSNGNMRLCDRLPIAQNKSIVVVRVGLRWLVLGVADEQITLLTELSEEESRIWRQSRPAETKADAPKFSDVMTNALRNRNGRK